MRENIRRLVATPNGSFWVFVAVFVIPGALFVTLCCDAFKSGYRFFTGTARCLLLPFLITAIVAILFLCLSILLEGQRLRATRLAFMSWTQQIVKPLLWGSVLGLFASSTFLLLASANVRFVHDAVMASSLGIYLSCCGFFIAFYGIYEEKLPIMDLEDFLYRLERDLQQCRRQIVFSFPGLSIGSVSAGGFRYDNYMKEIERIIQCSEDTSTGTGRPVQRAKIDKKFLLYTETDILLLYGAYARREAERFVDIAAKELERQDRDRTEVDQYWNEIETGVFRSEPEKLFSVLEKLSLATRRARNQAEHIAEMSMRINKAVAHSIDLIASASLKIEQRSHDDGEYKVVFVKPEFRAYYIIIDDIVYVIDALGLPIQKENGEYESAVRPDEDLIVDVIATRIHNGAIAGMLKKLVLRECEEFSYDKGSAEALRRSFPAEASKYGLQKRYVEFAEENWGQ